jgi:hexosaminidase
MKKYILSIAAAVGLTLSGYAATADYHVSPLPASITEATDVAPFILSESVTICYPTGDNTQLRNAQLLHDYILEQTGLDLPIKDKRGKYCIILESRLRSTNAEAYTLDVAPRQITINGTTPAGTFYGIQTLRKAIGNGATELPACNISDEPRFGYRGMHLDVSRHFFTTDEVKKYIDILAMHNVNRLHWHLTDDQGWRLEIKSHPELATEGQWRQKTVLLKNWGTFDNTPYGGAYTQEEVKDIINYAADRFITIIPEIDLPGHMQAALHCYPTLGCTGGPYDVWPTWGVSDDVLCIGNDATFSFLEDVMREVVELFPSEYIHIGGDECPKTRWKECPKCQARIKELGIKGDENHSAEEYLQSYVIKRMEKFINGFGRRIIGWDEILEGGVSPTATVMSWRGEAGGRKASAMGNDVIMVPYDCCYFDYYQAQDTDHEPFAIGGYIPLSKVYAYNPASDDMTAEQRKHIMGLQANLWTEYIATLSHAEYMLLPRLTALCEVEWCKPDNKDYNAFLQRLDRMQQLYNFYGINYCKTRE